MSNTKFLDAKGLETLWGLIKQEVSNNKITTINSTSIWEKKASYIPTPGEVIVYDDYKTTTDKEGNVQNIPSIKIGDGRTPVQQLEFISASVAERVAHKLTIGNLTFDGSEDVSVTVYDGELK